MISFLALCKERCSKIEEWVKMWSQIKKADWSRRREMINSSSIHRSASRCLSEYFVFWFWI
jgi:hypothetical protein